MRKTSGIILAMLVGCIAEKRSERCRDLPNSEIQRTMVPEYHLMLKDSFIVRGFEKGDRNINVKFVKSGICHDSLMGSAFVTDELNQPLKFVSFYIVEKAMDTMVLQSKVAETNDKGVARFKCGYKEAYFLAVFFPSYKVQVFKLRR